MLNPPLKPTTRPFPNHTAAHVLQYNMNTISTLNFIFISLHKEMENEPLEAILSDDSNKTVNQFNEPAGWNELSKQSNSLKRFWLFAVNGVI